MSERYSGTEYIPAPFFGVSRLSWLLPRWAIAVMGVTVDGLLVAVLMDAEGVLGRLLGADVLMLLEAENV